MSYSTSIDVIGSSAIPAVPRTFVGKRPNVSRISNKKLKTRTLEYSERATSPLPYDYDDFSPEYSLSLASSHAIDSSNSSLVERITEDVARALFAQKCAKARKSTTREPLPMLRNDRTAPDITHPASCRITFTQYHKLQVRSMIPITHGKLKCWFVDIVYPSE